MNRICHFLAILVYVSGYRKVGPRFGPVLITIDKLGIKSGLNTAQQGEKNLSF